ncbi:MAG: AEC family transporter [Clostridia bacterium]|nr:AEC family transporter [Clostridia bacterium]
MEMILLALGVVVPLFIIMAVGYTARRVGIISDSGVGTVNKLLFWVFLPCIMFSSIYTTDISDIDVRVVLFAVVGTVAVSVASFVFVPFFEKKRERRGVLIQGIIRGNEVYFGFPVISALIGDKYLGIAAIIVAATSIMYNIFSVIALEYYKGKVTSKGRIALNVIKNPLLVSTLIAIAFLFLHVPVPDMIFSAISSMSKVATPLALFLLGASFSFKASRDCIGEVSALVVIKLAVLPAIAIGVSTLLGFRNFEIVLLFVTFGVPTAVASYSLARELESDYVLAGQIVVFTSVFAILSTFLWTLAIQMMGLI